MTFPPDLPLVVYIVGMILAAVALVAILRAAHSLEQAKKLT
jgi:hypothetical protein